MIKAYIQRLALNLTLLAVLAVLYGCANVPCTGTPQECAIDSAAKATLAVDQVVLAADAAVKSGSLKGEDATTTLISVKAARDGLNVAKSMIVTDPNGANDKIKATIAVIAALQTYIATKGVTK